MTLTYTDEQIDHMLANSFKDLHAKGLDYVCLSRTPALTKKVYFFDAVPSGMVVNPHNHRYNFSTSVLAGRLKDTRYEANYLRGPKYHRYDWYTPLNGGVGFDWAGEMCLNVKLIADLSAGSPPWDTKYDDIHTIEVEPGTILALDQFEDILPLETPTQTFMPDGRLPNLDELYKRFTRDELVARLKQLEELGYHG